MEPTTPFSPEAAFQGLSVAYDDGSASPASSRRRSSVSPALATPWSPQQQALGPQSTPARRFSLLPKFLARKQRANTVSSVPPPLPACPAADQRPQRPLSPGHSPLRLSNRRVESQQGPDSSLLLCTGPEAKNSNSINGDIYGSSAMVPPLSSTYYIPPPRHSIAGGLAHRPSTSRRPMDGMCEEQLRREAALRFHQGMLASPASNSSSLPPTATVNLAHLVSSPQQFHQQLQPSHAQHPSYYRHRVTDTYEPRAGSFAMASGSNATSFAGYAPHLSPPPPVTKYGMPRLPRGSVSADKLVFLDCALAYIAMQQCLQLEKEEAQQAREERRRPIALDLGLNSTSIKAQQAAVLEEEDTMEVLDTEVPVYGGTSSKLNSPAFANASLQPPRPVHFSDSFGSESTTLSWASSSSSAAAAASLYPPSPSRRRRSDSYATNPSTSHLMSQYHHYPSPPSSHGSDLSHSFSPRASTSGATLHETDEEGSTTSVGRSPASFKSALSLGGGSEEQQLQPRRKSSGLVSSPLAFMTHPPLGLAPAGYQARSTETQDQQHQQRYLSSSSASRQKRLSSLPALPAVAGGVAF